ncbi:thiamine pyrophosphate-requiring protein [Ramlibacter alkalitolerans]|uniref:Thiamine pyrophosphate-requiring protein n=1 Tax=Ramlibacter alkalitolerans TaxID=2039631 RepID=A0ABS1JID9_9BURK|nr:thiamine pyrophosphate-requiring protein [Ramlibacter alkalitolerans]MBL0423983.1 thiamine pyrophosphate-requiring protein [Ramlibacter alkalitolerans]
MAATVSDQVLQRLHAWGVRRVFGYPGDGINGFLGAFDRMGEELRFIQARHEELAAFMACAHAKFTGEIGVCIATSGPGAIHLLNGLYDAKADHQPVLAIVGQAARAAMGGDYQQEVDLASLFKDVAHEYVHTAMVPEQVRHLVDRAVRIALDQRTVTCLIFPHDVQELEAVPEPPREHSTVHSGIGRTMRARVPDAAGVQAAADVLNAGSKVAILAGAGALHATDELLAVADVLGAGIAKALLGKAAVPDDVPHVTGSIGLLGTQPSWDLMEGCDTLLMVGTSFPYSEFLPAEGKARAVQIDLDGRKLALRYPSEVNLVGDSRETLQALLPLLARKSDRGWQQSIEEGVRRWWEVAQARAMNEADPVNPQRFFWELSPRLPERCILTCDSGTSAAWYARDLKIRRGMQASLSGGLATMGPAVPYALAAKLASPDRPVIAITGDGAMQMIGINGLVTLAERFKDWADPRIVVVVLHNGDLNMVTWEQRIMGGDRRFDDSQLLPKFPFAEYARMLGLGGVRIDKPEQIVPAIEQALAADRPTLLEVVTDPNVPPLPPHVSAKQTKAYLKALLHRDPESLAMVKATAREWWDGIRAGKGQDK